MPQWGRDSSKGTQDEQSQIWYNEPNLHTEPKMGEEREKRKRKDGTEAKRPHLHPVPRRPGQNLGREMRNERRRGRTPVTYIQKHVRMSLPLALTC